MKKLLLLPVIIAAAFMPNTRSGFSKTDTDALVNNLVETKNFFLENVKGLSDAQLNFKAAPDRWSIRECAEHIALSETFLFNFVDSAMMKPADSTKRQEIKVTDEVIMQKIPDRSQKFKTFEPLEPKGKTLDETVSAFTSERDKHIEFVKNTSEENLRNHTMPNPAVGTVDVYQAILFMSEHTRRHTLQIQEVKADANFPKN